MQGARDYAVALSPKSLIRSVTNVGTSLTRRMLFPPLPEPAQRPFRVSNFNRSSKKGIMAGTLKELTEKATETLLLDNDVIFLVLEEDGTVVDTEEFFQSLEDNTQFLLLEGKQKWTKESNAQCSAQQKKKTGIANVTFDLYKLNPKDLGGCLNIKATLYEIYSVSWDIQFLSAKKVLRQLIRGLSYLAQVTGHLLLYGGSLMMQWTESSDEEGTFSRSRHV
ncbi:hypothetical protein GDO86_011133 [Hymenochirus boettgeri]|uniref:CIDE-N domain-containing protein n=1 Tax=Hymenochirus boettgeri TaxID=247094 RepID=A0A8T2JIC4_9PIPI|nr:hypothetical protein GDO86_011133 [Hymenochirus boettgeri]